MPSRRASFNSQTASESDSESNSPARTSGRFRRRRCPDPVGAPSIITREPRGPPKISPTLGFKDRNGLIKGKTIRENKINDKYKYYAVNSPKCFKIPKEYSIYSISDKDFWKAISFSIKGTEDGWKSYRDLYDPGKTITELDPSNFTKIHQLSGEKAQFIVFGEDSYEISKYENNNNRVTETKEYDIPFENDLTGHIILKYDKHYYVMYN